MQCAQCAYMLGPFDKICPRCQYVPGTPVNAPTPPVQPVYVPVPPANPPLQTPDPVKATTAGFFGFLGAWMAAVGLGCVLPVGGCVGSILLAILIALARHFLFH